VGGGNPAGKILPLEKNDGMHWWGWGLVAGAEENKVPEVLGCSRLLRYSAPKVLP